MKLDIIGTSLDTQNEYVLRLHFRESVTAHDRENLLKAINAFNLELNHKIRLREAKEMRSQLLAQLEGLAIALDAKGEKSAAHTVRSAMQDIILLTDNQTKGVAP